MGHISPAEQAAGAPPQPGACRRSGLYGVVDQFAAQQAVHLEEDLP